MKIAIIPGHEPIAHGAARGVVSEYGLTCAICGDLVFRLQKAGHQAWLIGAHTNAEQIKDINKRKTDCGLELHFNSHSDPNVCGTEVLHAGSVKGEILARNIQWALVDRLKTKDRGVKTGYYRGDPGRGVIPILRKTDCPFVVPEPLFLSNETDFSRIDIQAISIALFDGICAFEEVLS